MRPPNQLRCAYPHRNTAVQHDPKIAADLTLITVEVAKTGPDSL